MAIRAFLDFCYFARRSLHTEDVLSRMQEALANFQQLRSVFQEVGVRPDGFALPRQHSLVHYVRNIRLFGSPNGLCSSITESRHITAVKRPWRRSSRHNALLQMLQTNTRLSKLVAARTEFGRRGMLQSDVLTSAKVKMGTLEEERRNVLQTREDEQTAKHIINDEDEAGHYDGPALSSFFELARRPGESQPQSCRSALTFS